jgi:hypothetical protein
VMGQSGGRARKNPLGAGATRRSTPRQRDLVDPPGRPEDSLELLTGHMDNHPVGSGLTTAWMSLLAFVAVSGWLIGCVYVGVQLAT